MAVGDLLFALLRANATVDVQLGTTTTEGGTVVTWDESNPLAEGVNVLVSEAGGSRDFPNGTYAGRYTYSVAGTDPALVRSDARLKVTAAGPGLTWMVGRYLSVVGVQGHPQGSGGLRGARINLQCVVQEVPFNAGSEL